MAKRKTGSDAKAVAFNVAMASEGYVQTPDGFWKKPTPKQKDASAK